MKVDLTYLCKDCKHSFVPISERILTFGFASEYSYKCKKGWKPERTIENPVVGLQTTKAEYKSCNITRMAGEVCGPDAKYWAPKKKKDLFKMLTKESYD